jgi:hypothetical protein
MNDFSFFFFQYLMAWCRSNARLECCHWARATIWHESSAGAAFAMTMPIYPSCWSATRKPLSKCSIGAPHLSFLNSKEILIRRWINNSMQFHFFFVQVEHLHLGAEHAFTRGQSRPALRAHYRLRGFHRQPPEQDPAIGRAHHRHLIRQVS